MTSADSRASSGRLLCEIAPKIAAAFTAPMPGSKSSKRRHDASSRGLSTIRRWASTSLM